MSKHIAPAYNANGVRVAPYTADDLFVLNYPGSTSEAYRALFERRKAAAARADKAWQASLDAILDAEE